LATDTALSIFSSASRRVSSIITAPYIGSCLGCYGWRRPEPAVRG
jgi:hypothetical protein